MLVSENFSKNCYELKYVIPNQLAAEEFNGDNKIAVTDTYLNFRRTSTDRFGGPPNLNLGSFVLVFSNQEL